MEGLIGLLGLGQHWQPGGSCLGKPFFFNKSSVNMGIVRKGGGSLTLGKKFLEHFFYMLNTALILF